MNLKKLLLLTPFLFFGFTSVAQKADTLHMESNLWKVTYWKGSNPIDLDQVLEEILVNESAYYKMKHAKSNYVFSQILGVTGGFLIGWPVGAAIAGGNPNWSMAVIGAGVLVVSIPVTISFNKKAKSAIREYNQGILSSSYKNVKPQCSLVFGGNGLGLKIKF